MTARKGRKRAEAIDVQLGLSLAPDAAAVRRLCGVDEAGRGPLAGPVFAAAVVLDPARPIEGLADSKILTARRREALFDDIRERALGWHIAFASVEEIDTLNILHATMLAMQRAVRGLAATGVTPDLVQIDGNRCPEVPFPVEAVVKGDATVQAISAASILAKVARDRELLTLHAAYPEYGFDAHVGYGTPQHLEALSRFGATPHHRRSFAPVREALIRSGALPQSLAGMLPQPEAADVEAAGVEAAAVDHAIDDMVRAFDAAGPALT
ncbi:ribonuclease HII [Cupriavidus sp. AU9028]|uniref:ribonuclease HII n=1 Tax=Cupriavidus sp. AU9028 TaxID=2871157 RepID=UPI001C9541D7|nr:ribonuclease HII [Cupriavidus sp. AU9028]MBY4897982.1 ribonuclease HII [Cupriavidus sp. AU9028]